MMRLRNLSAEDADRMLEWMHDVSVTYWMDRDFSRFTKADCIKFIEYASKEYRLKFPSAIHMAIAGDEDSGEYMGTVSLKQIDWKHRTAEFAIVTRKCAMGHGVSGAAMREILKTARELGLRYVYWYARWENVRAVRFYEKNGYQAASRDRLARTGCQLPDEAEFLKYIWYLEELSGERGNTDV